MNLNGGFFTDSLNGVPEIIQKIVKCEVKRCVYPTEAGAKKAAVKKMAKHGYTFNEQEMANLKIR